jgi:hypothetical protein
VRYLIAGLKITLPKKILKKISVLDKSLPRTVAIFVVDTFRSTMRIKHTRQILF